MPLSDLVSVIMPAYNHEKYVQEAIRSIIAQTYHNIELIVVDDGSKDNTSAKINELKDECEKRFVRVVFEHQENKGIIKTLNRLIDLSQGKYVYPIASDDMSKPQAVKTLQEFLSQNPDYVLTVGDNEIINARSERSYWDNKRNFVEKEKALYLTFGDFFHVNEPNNRHHDFGSYESLLRENYLPNGYLMSTKALMSAGKYNPDILFEDWYMHIQLAKLGKMKYIPKILFSYRWHDSNTIKSETYLKKIDIIRRSIYLQEKDYCFKNGYKKIWEILWAKELAKTDRKTIMQIHFTKKEKLVLVRVFGIDLLKIIKE
jgi:alpha-1,3-rhamnosyltransferase